MTTSTNPPKLILQALYLKNSTIKTFLLPQIFRESWQPEIQLNMDIASEKTENTNYEVILTLAMAIVHQQQRVLTIEVKQAGLFDLHEFPQQELHQILASHCPNLLFDYARQLISDLVAELGFANIYLAPVNFAALYQQKMQEQKTIST